MKTSKVGDVDESIKSHRGSDQQSDCSIIVGVLEAGTCKLGDMLVDSPVMFMQTFNNPDYGGWSRCRYPR